MAGRIAVLALMLGACVPAVSEGQEFTETRAKSFHRTVLKAAQKSVREGKLSRRDAFRLRVAMISPAFRKSAENLAVIQMQASGESLDGIPLTEAGHIDRASIDWDELIEFIEKLIPLIMKLIEIFGGLA